MILQLLPVAPILWGLVGLFGPPRAWERRALFLGERLVFRAALGLGLLAYLVLALGLLGALNRGAILALLVVLLLASAPGQRAIAIEIRARWRERKGRPDPTTVALALGLVLLVLLMALGCASPPSAADWDGLSYHLADPKLFLRAGRIFYVPWEHHSNFPFTVEMLFTVGLAFGSAALAKGFHLAMGLLTAAGLAAAAARFAAADGDPEGVRLRPILPAALFLAIPLVFWESTVAYVDLGATLFAFLGVYAFTAAMEARPNDGADPRTGWLTLSGVATGLAIGCKTTNGIFLILLLAWGVGAAIRSADGARRIGAVLLRFLLPAAAIASPWFIKSVLWTGSPVYPFLYGLFGGRNWNASLATTYAAEQAGFGYGLTPRALLLLPWNLTFHADAFSKGIGQFASPGPFLLAFLPLVALARPAPRWLRAQLWIGVGFVAIWALLSQQVRYLLPLLPILCLPAAYAVERARIGAAGRTAAGAFLAVALALVAARGYVYVEPMIPVALGAVSPDAYLNRTLQLDPAIRFINRALPNDARIVLIEETRGFYLDRDYLWGNPGHHTLIPWATFSTPGQMAAWFRAAGVTHLLLNARWMRRGWGGSPWEALIVRAVRDGALRPVFGSRGVIVYEIRRPGSKEPSTGRGDRTVRGEPV